MGTLTKRELVVQISNETGLVQHQVFDVIQRTLDLITDALAKGNNVELRNFGIMEVRLTKPRVGRNPNQPGSSFVIPARATVKFKAGKVMRQLVSERSAGMQTVAAELKAAKQKTATPKAARLVEPAPVKKRVAKKVLQ
ncbi:MAG: hup [Chthoniobacteraceae bacterium]|nr:hup [Chthoniobacteraceae bacterium]